MKTKSKFTDFFKAFWQYIKDNKIEFVIIIGAVILDLVTKTIIQSNMEEEEIIQFIPNFLNWHYTLNNKAGFGWAFGLEKIMSDKGIMIFFIVLTFLALILFFFLLYWLRNKKFVAKLAVSFIIGGAIGNLIDRIAFGYVRDFIEIVYFGLDLGPLGKSFAVFNIADSFLTVGVILFAVFIIFFFEDKNSKEKKKSDREMTTAELNGLSTEKQENNSEGGANSEEFDSCGNR